VAAHNVKSVQWAWWTTESVVDEGEGFGRGLQRWWLSERNWTLCSTKSRTNAGGRRRRPWKAKRESRSLLVVIFLLWCVNLFFFSRESWVCVRVVWCMRPVWLSVGWASARVVWCVRQVWVWVNLSIRWKKRDCHISLVKISEGVKIRMRVWKWNATLDR